jgi:hypothetical protein
MTNASASLINRAELIRKQLADLALVLKGHPESEPILDAARALDKKIIDFEDFFFPVGLTGSGDSLRWPDKFYAKLGFLARHVAEGDFPPTTQQIEVHALFKAQLAEREAEFRKLVDGDLAALNKMLRDRNVPHIVSRF